MDKKKEGADRKLKKAFQRNALTESYAVLRDKTEITQAILDELEFLRRIYY